MLILTFYTCAFSQSSRIGVSLSQKILRLLYLQTCQSTFRMAQPCLSSSLLVHCVVSGEDYGQRGSASPFLPFTGEHGEPLAIWVASAIEKIPPGSLIINPQTGKPYLNPDGSVYRWYPPTDKLGSTAVSRSSPVDQSKVCHIELIFS